MYESFVFIMSSMIKIFKVLKIFKYRNIIFFLLYDIYFNLNKVKLLKFVNVWRVEDFCFKFLRLCNILENIL